MATHAPNQPFEIVVQLSLAGVPVTGLTGAADFTLGVVKIQQINPVGASGGTVSLTATVEYEVEELQTGAALGTYALKFDGSMIPDEADYLITVVKGGVFDPLEGVVEVRGPTDLDELLALAGKNVVGIPSGYDELTGNLSGITLFFFASKEDAEDYITEYFDPVLGGGVGLVTAATAAKVTDFLEEATVYNAVNGRIEGFIRKKD